MFTLVRKPIPRAAHPSETTEARRASPPVIAPSLVPPFFLRKAVSSASRREPDELLPETAASLLQRVAARRGQGQPLPRSSRARMENAFGADLQHVRVHADPEANALARAAHARAFACGADIYMAPGAYRPCSSSGEHLLAHEVAHVVQQATGQVPPGVSRPGDRHEVAADAAADAAMTGGRIAAAGRAQAAPSGAQSLQRDIEFLDSMMFRLGKRFDELCTGLYKYLAIRVTLDWKVSLLGKEVTHILKKPEIDTARQSEITDLFSQNYKGFDAARADAVDRWFKVRDAVVRRLQSGTIEVKAMTEEEKRNSRGAYADLSSDEIKVNIEDMMNYTTSGHKVNLSFDGFWRIIHEVLHLALRIPSDFNDKDLDAELKAKGASEPGKVEAYLNPLRIGFGLPIRKNYSEKDEVTGKQFIRFGLAGDGRFEYP